MTLEKTFTFKTLDFAQTQVDLENLENGDELFLHKEDNLGFCLYSPDGCDLVSFKNEEELVAYLGFSFTDFEDYSFLISNVKNINFQNNEITLTVKFQVSALAC